MDIEEASLPQDNASDAVGEATVSMAFANVVALALLVVAILAFVLPSRLLFSGDGVGPQLPRGLSGTLLLILIFVAGIVIHELLHGLGFVLVGKAPLSAVRFGIFWKGLAPYAHCDAPVKVSAYRVTVALPGVLLGVIPGLLGLLLQIPLMAYLGAFMTAAAGGDLAVLLAVRKLPGDTLVRDHPSRPGCLVLKEEPNELNAE